MKDTFSYSKQILLVFSNLIYKALSLSLEAASVDFIPKKSIMDLFTISKFITSQFFLSRHLIELFEWQKVPIFLVIFLIEF